MCCSKMIREGKEKEGSQLKGWRDVRKIFKRYLEHIPLWKGKPEDSKL